jgi:hypothetical protein
MILLDDVVEVAATAHDDGLPPRVFLAQQPQRPVARGVTVEVHFARPSRPMRGHSPPEEGLRSVHASIRTQKKVHGLAVFVDRPIQIVSSAPNGNGGLVYAPG